MGPMSGPRRAWLVAAYAAVAVVMTWPYVNYRDFGTASYGGDARLIIWTLAWDNHALLSGLPLFESNLFFPAADSLRYNEHLFGVSLFTLPWAAMGASPVLAYNATWWLALPLNGLATFALLYRLVRAAVPAFVGSLVFTCSFYVMLHAHGHLHLVWLWPLPLSMLLLDRWFESPRLSRLALWLATMVVGALTSWYIAVMLLLVNGLMAITLFAMAAGASSEPTTRSSLLSRLGQLAAAGLVLAASLAPFARHYVGFSAAPGEAEAFAATIASYVVPPENTVAGRAWTAAGLTPTPGAIWGEQTLFAGWIALTLAAIGGAALVRGRHVVRRAWIFPLLAAVGFLLSLGPAPALLGGRSLAPFAWLTALPGFEGLRAAARFGAIAMLGLAGLAAIGGAALTRALLPQRRALLLALGPLMLLEWFVVGFPAGVPKPYPIPPIYQTPEVKTARSLVSLPEYTDTPEWFRNADYLYYSTSHWRPIVNGFGRTQPANHAHVLERVRGFPATAPDLRTLGVQYVVVHADRLPNHGADLLAAAKANAGCRLVQAIGSDYLFELVG
jgi:hypothetical protein